MDRHGRARLTKALSGRAASGQRRHYRAFGCRGCITHGYFTTSSNSYDHLNIDDAARGSADLRMRRLRRHYRFTVLSP
eukprot:1362757-Pleurochrysis_carterae.AAC.1